mmetsp:Transcript_21835/g.42392  ORF Transcript_21835/g.42392 Transcript_21835/m.42392 type:complete len:175 (-) Transcript_21835:205-729(-)
MPQFPAVHAKRATNFEPAELRFVRWVKNAPSKEKSKAMADSSTCNNNGESSWRSNIVCNEVASAVLDPTIRETIIMKQLEYIKKAMNSGSDDAKVNGDDSAILRDHSGTSIAPDVNAQVTIAALQEQVRVLEEHLKVCQGLNARKLSILEREFERFKETRKPCSCSSRSSCVIA